MIAGVISVRNEIDVIDFVIKHHFSQGLDAIFVCDNGSSDGTFEHLTLMSEKDSRLFLTSDSGDFHQSQITTKLSMMAKDRGAEWIVPFDADEIWFSKNKISEDLKNIKDDAVKIRINNYVQNYFYDPSNHPYESIKYMIPEKFSEATESQVMKQKRSVIEFPWDYKHIIKTSGLKNVGPGSHVYENNSKNVYEGKIFHIAQVFLRSKNDIYKKIDHGIRLKNAGYPVEHGWECQRLIGMNDDQIEEEWLLNSEVGGKLYRKYSQNISLQKDDTVYNFYQNYRKMQ